MSGCPVLVASAIVGAWVLAGCPSDERAAELFASTYGEKRAELVALEEEFGNVVKVDGADPERAEKYRALAHRAKRLSDWFETLYPPVEIWPAVNDLAAALGRIEFDLRFLAADIKNAESRVTLARDEQNVAHKLKKISRLRRNIDEFAGVT